MLKRLSSMTRMHADLVLLLAAALWGLAFIMQKTAMDAVGPLTFVALRGAMAAAVLMPFAVIETRRASGPPSRAFFTLAGLGAAALIAGASLQQTGIVTATVTNASFLTALYAIFVPFVAWLIYRKPPRPLVWAAAIVSLIGIALLGGGATATLTSGDVLIALSALFWAVHILITTRAAEAGRPILFVMVQFAIVALVMGPIAHSAEQPDLAAITAVWPEVAYVGIISSALTFSLFTFAMRYAPPPEAAIILSSENLFAALAAAILLGERMGWINWLGAALILAAVLTVQVTGARRAHPPPR